eukprot:g6215.t1
MATINVVQTTPFTDQKPGTSGLRKKTKVFLTKKNYLENFVQSIFDALPQSEIQGSAIVVSGDGRFYNDKAIQVITKMAAANGISKIIVGTDGLLATPAMSAVIRERNVYGGIILTASHNPGGPDDDFGIKYNVTNGGPAPSNITNAIFEKSKSITNYKICAGMEDIDISKKASYEFDVEGGQKFYVEVIDPVEEYLKLLKTVFNFDLIRKLIQRSDFNFVFDALNGIAGPYATRIFGEELGVDQANLLNCVPKPDFGGLHPDPNLTYAANLVKLMGLKRDGTVLSESEEVKFDLGAAADGDADRNMILGKRFFVTPSDSVAIIAAKGESCIPYFKDGICTVARSMPTSRAIDYVAAKKGIKVYEVPTGWKYFGNLMDATKFGKDSLNPLICGEESFGTGASHIREKDGPWAVLCWLSILAAENETREIGSLKSVEDITKEHWRSFGRCYYCRYDYETVESKAALDMYDNMREIIKQFNSESGISSSNNIEFGNFKLSVANEFSYTDPIDGSVNDKQGLRFIFEDGSRIIFRLSGTGSVGATIRLYLEKYEPGDSDNLFRTTQTAMKPLVEVALSISKLETFTGRTEPTVIT